MATKTPVEKTRAESEVGEDEYVDCLGRVGKRAKLRDVIARMNEKREELRRKHGPFDTLPTLRDFREDGR